MVAIGLHLVAGLEMALEILALGCHLQGMKAGFLTIRCEEIGWITRTTIEEEPSSIGQCPWIGVIGIAEGIASLMNGKHSKGDCPLLLHHHHQQPTVADGHMMLEREAGPH